MNYPKTDGAYGSNYRIAEGVYVGVSNRGSWELVVKRGGERRKKAYGKGDENLIKAIKAAELLAAKLDLPLNREEDPTSERTFSMVIEEWRSLNTQPWQPGTRERYQGIVRDFLRPLHNLPLKMVDG